MPDFVMKQVEAWDKKDNVSSGWEFLNRNKQPFCFEEDVTDEQNPMKTIIYQDVPAEFPRVEMECNNPNIIELVERDKTDDYHEQP